MVLSRPLAYFLNIAAFVAGMVLTSSILLETVPFPKVSSLWRKYQHVEDNRDQYDLLFIGSSRVFHEFIPAQFDEYLASRGHKLKSLNFGQDGMWPPESLYMLREILELKPKGLKWVMIDLMQIKPLLEGNETSMRSIYWHDTRHTWLALRHFATVSQERQHTLGEKLGHICQHLGLWIQRNTCAGTGSERLQILLKRQREKNSEPLKNQGWEPGPYRPLSAEDTKAFWAEVERLKQIPPQPMPPLLKEAFSDIIKEVRAAGAEPIFVVASGFYGRERFTDWFPGVPMFAFDDPEKFPELYNPKHRFDVHHLDPTGAKDATRRLAERFAQFLEEKK